MGWRLNMLACFLVTCLLQAGAWAEEDDLMLDPPIIAPNPAPSPISIPLKIRLIDPELMPALPLSLQPKPGFLLEPPPDPVQQVKDRELRKAMSRRVEVQFGGERVKVRVRKRGIIINWVFD